MRAVVCSTFKVLEKPIKFEGLAPLQSLHTSRNMSSHSSFTPSRLHVIFRRARPRRIRWRANADSIMWPPLPRHRHRRLCRCLKNRGIWASCNGEAIVLSKDFHLHSHLPRSLNVNQIWASAPRLIWWADLNCKVLSERGVCLKDDFQV